MEALHSYRGDPETCTYLPFEPQSVGAIRERLAGVMGSASLDDPSTQGSFSVSSDAATVG